MARHKDSEWNLPDKPQVVGSYPTGASNHRTPKSGGETEKPLSRQRKWQLKQIANGNCERCGKPAVVGAILCPKHLTKSRLYGRQRNGCKPNSQTGLGRPALPLVTRKEAQQ